MYEIKNGTKNGAYEIYFDAKPNQETREALKGLRFRWNGKKVCWYGFCDIETIKNAIEAKPEAFDTEAFRNEFNTEATAGYMGGIETTGSKSGLRLYGKDLTAAIRKDLKKWGVSGVSVACHSHSLCQDLIITITPQNGDVLSLDDYKKAYKNTDGSYNFGCAGKLSGFDSFDYVSGGRWTRTSYEEFAGMTDSEKAEIMDATLESNYREETSGTINEYHIADYKALSASFRTRFERIKAIIDSYNHDDSNAMVDYFNRNFYETYKLREA